MDCTCTEKKDSCDCKSQDDVFFENWCKSLEDKEQPTCNVENQEDCDNCGS